MNETQPPIWPTRFLRWFCRPDLYEDVSGDLAELYAYNRQNQPGKAKTLYFLDVLLMFRPGIIRNFKTQNKPTFMFRNYLKIALRNALRYKGYTVLNILGLVVGIASSFTILLWVNDEVKVDKFHSNGDAIYQLWRNMKQSNGVTRTTESQPKPLADHVRETYPEVEDVAQMSWEIDMSIGQGDKVTTEMGRFVSVNYLELFDFEVVLGDRELMLDDPSGIVLTRSLAERHFGEDWKNSIGKSLRIESDYDLQVTGIIEDPGPHSSIQFNWLAPAEIYFRQNDWVDDWGNGSFSIYAVIPDESKVADVSERVYPEILDHTQGADNAGHETVVLQRFSETYLYSNFDNGVVSGGRIDYVRLLSIIAIVTLIIACINFMNLATARAGRRSREIGIRKVMGAQKGSLRTQFFFEAGLLTVISVVLSMVIVFLVLPSFNLLANKELILDFTSIELWIFVLSITVIVTILSGSYPALLLARFKIVDAIKGTVKQASITAWLRKGLVVFQFAISTMLIVMTVVIYQQISFAMNKDLGMEKENIVAVALRGNMSQRLNTYKTELLRIPEVKSVTAASGNPLRYGRSTSSASWEGKDPDQEYEVNVILSDDQFIDVMGMDIVAGRGFEKQSMDSTNFIINEVAAELMGFDDPIGEPLSFWGVDGHIVGVVKNFHMRGMQTAIAPLVISCISTNNLAVALVKITGDTPSVLDQIEKITTEMNPESVFAYEFLDQTYANYYQNELTVRTLASIFSGISILISCLGLFGLASYSAETRSREIGVRKVHGASVAQILMLLSRDYARLILISFIISIPIAWYFVQSWLEGFEFRMNLGPGVFVMAAGITFITGVVTILTKSYQAATINPAATLKDE